MKAISKSGGMIVLASALLAAAWSLARADVSITTCGQSVPAKQTGSLDIDLVCPSSANAVFLDDKATLTFNNHSISGSSVFCSRSCTLVGPGEVGQTSVDAILTGGGGKFVAQDLTVRNSAATGIYSQARRSSFTNVTATQNSASGITVIGSATGTNVTVTDNGAAGLTSVRRKIKLVGLTASGNGFAGVLNNGGRTLLIDSTLTGNTSPMNGPLDLFSFKRPKLVNTTCEHSLGPVGQPWGVCSLD